MSIGSRLSAVEAAVGSASIHPLQRLEAWQRRLMFDGVPLATLDHWSGLCEVYKAGNATDLQQHELKEVWRKLCARYLELFSTPYSRRAPAGRDK